MMGKALQLAVAALLGSGLAAPALAQRASQTCGPGTETAIVAGVSDALELLLDDGRTIRLAGIETHPGPPASAALTGWLAGETVSIAPLAAKPDRWGRTPAHVFGTVKPTASRPASSMSVAEALVDAGFARVRPLGEGKPCLAALLRAENAARIAKSGLWANPANGVFQASDGAELKRHAGAFVIVEGRVSRIGEGRQRFYIDFGGGRGDFSASLIKRNARAFDSGEKPLKSLIGRQIRIRGILETRFRPEIELTSPDEIEFIEGSDTGAKIDASVR